MTQTAQPRPIGVAIVGAGRAGVQHLQALERSPDTEVVAIHDTDDRRVHDALASADKSGPVPRIADSLDDLLDDQRVEMVAIATPPATHFELAMRIIDAGRALLLEKPPLLSSQELELVLDASAARGSAAGVMLQHRFRLPAAAVAAEWTPDTIATVEVVRYRPPAHYHRDPWRTDPVASGGGLMAHLGVHFLDLACQLLGGPNQVAGWVDLMPETGLDQRVAFTARFETGAILNFTGTTALDVRGERLAVYDGGRKLEIDGTHTSYADGGVPESLTMSTAGLRALTYQDMATAVRTGKQPRVVCLSTARGVVAFLEAARKLPGQEQKA